MTEQRPLVPVEFKKGREHKPRISKPYVPGRHHEKYWTEAELAVVREHYPTGGVNACLPLLPGRKKGSIYQAAILKLGLRSSNRTRASNARLTPEEDEALREKIRAAWPDLAGKGSMTRFCAELGYPRHMISIRATDMGLTAPRFKEPPWSEAETALLKSKVTLTPESISTIFSKHGYARSANAIKIRRIRLGLDRTDPNVFSGTSAAQLLGLDNKTVTAWCVQGLIPAERRETQRLPQQGGDPWLITRAVLRRFVIDNPERIDLRKVQRIPFIDLLAGEWLGEQPEASE